MDCIDFLCINCQELISEDMVSNNSLYCVFPSDSVLNNDTQPIISQYVYKLTKLKNALSDRISRNIAQVDKELYEFLILQANEILTIENPSKESLEKCQSTANTLDRYSHASLSTPLLLYNERLKLIAMESVRILENILNNEQINKLDLNYREIQQAKENVFNGKIIDKGNIEEISSQISQFWNG